MSSWRQARAEELRYLWPAARAAHVAPSLEAFEAFRAAGPWRVRVADSGDAMVLRRWRAGLDLLSLRAAWAPAARLPWLVAEARAVAAARGFRSLLSPLVSQSASAAYVASGMQVEHRLVAYQGLVSRISRNRLPESPALAVGRLRSFAPDDLAELVQLDARCFDGFWRYGPEEFAGIVEAERVVVFEVAEKIVGYASASVLGATATLGRLAVAPEVRRQKVAAALVTRVAASVAREGAIGINLCTQQENGPSRALYEGLGLEAVQEPYVIAACPAGAQPDA